jgi:hypothetical protein
MEIKSESQKLKDIMPVVFPASYKNVSLNKVDSNDGLAQALRLLKDYTKGNSAISRFFYGHWNRHYVVEVNAIVKRVHADINSVDELLTELYKINIMNPNGSLATRIRYIEENCQFSEEQDNQIAPHL